MSKFVKALEQAERERVLREQARQPEANPTGLSPRAPAAPREDPAPERAPVAAEHPSAPPVVESVFYQSLASTIQRFISKGIRRLVITSSGPEEGKSTITAHLGRALAKSGKDRVVLVDADQIRPTLHKIFGLDHPRGLGEILKEIYQLEIGKDNPNQFGLGDWVELLRIQAKTGTLLVAEDGQELSILFRKGRISGVSWQQRPEHSRLGSLLVTAGRITEEQKTVALRLQRDSPAPLGNVLCAFGYIEPADLEGALQSQFKDCLHRVLALQRPTYQFSELAEEYLPTSSADSSELRNGAPADDLIVTRLKSRMTQPYLTGQISRYLKDTEIRNLKILTSGSPPCDLQDRSIAEQFKALLDSLARTFDVVLVDSPPVAPSSPAATLATLADGVLLVVKSNGLDLRIIQQAKEHLEQSNAHILGVVLNQVHLRHTEYHSATILHSANTGRQC